MYGLLSYLICRLPLEEMLLQAKDVGHTVRGEHQTIWGNNAVKFCMHKISDQGLVFYMAELLKTKLTGHSIK
jgi:hypothetical protein